jgi:two-component system sensor kinase
MTLLSEPPPRTGPRPIGEWLFQQSFPLDEALETARALTRCLADWHQSGRVHGGLSGNCICRDEKYGIQLLDADRSEAPTQPDFTSLPTAAVVFLAPESSGSLARPISPAADLYSVGVLMFGMLTGRPPITAASASEYLDRQLCMEAPRLRELGLDVPPPLCDLVARLLRRDPRDRYETARGLLYDLERIEITDDPSRNQTMLAIGTADIRQSLTEANNVGRESELAIVQREMESSARRGGIAQWVVGADVNGRQCFLDEIELRCKAQRLQVCRGGLSSGSPRPLQTLEPVLAFIADRCLQDNELANRVSQATAEYGATLAEFLPALAHLWRATERPSGPDSYARARAVYALQELLVSFASDRDRVVLVLDELDLADDLTKSVVNAVLDRIGRDRGQLAIQLVISCESTAGITTGEHETQIRLGPLSRDSLTQYLHSIAGKLAPEISDAIVEVAAGDAVLATTILRRLIDRGTVKPSAHGWRAEGPLSESLLGDQCIAQSLEREVQSLTPAAIQILATAAVIGQRFRLATLSHLTHANYAEVLEVCHDGLRRRLLWRDSRAGDFRFANHQIHAQLSARLSDQQRQRLHLEIAAYVRQHDPSDVYQLAVHYDAAGERRQALHHALQAARLARQQYSLSIARDQLQIAARWVSPDDPRTGLQIWGSLGEIDLLTGQYDDAEAHFARALSLAQPGLEMAMVQTNIGELAFKRGRFSEAAHEYERALAMTGLRVPKQFVAMFVSLLCQVFFQLIHTWLPLRWISGPLPPSETDCLRLQLLSRLSHVYWFSRHKLWTLGNHLRSLNMAERFAPSATLAAVYSEHGPVMSLLRWFGRANHYGNRSLEIRQNLNDVWGQGQSHHYLSVVKLAECRFDDAIADATTAVELLRKMGDVWEMNMARYQAANAHYRIGNEDQATELATEMYQTGCQIGDLQATGISLDVWSRTSPRTLPLELVAREAARERPDAQSHAQTQLAHAIMLLYHKRTDEAIETLREAIQRSELAGHLNTYISPCYAWYVTALRRRIEQTSLGNGRILRSRIRVAQRAARTAYRVAKGFPADRAHALRELGLLKLIAGQPRSAARRLRASLASAVRYHQPREEQQTLECLLKLHQTDSSLLGPADPSWPARYTELQQTASPATKSESVNDGSRSNLSLADRFVTLLQSGRRIAQALSAEAVYAEASAAARKLLRGQRVDVVEVQQVAGQCSLTPRLESAGDSTGRARIAANERIIHAALAQGQAVCDSSVRTATAKTGSAIAVPIAFRGANVAAILVTHDELNDVFNTDEQRIADFVATLAGAALENADGFLQLRQLNDTLEQRVQERTAAAEERTRQLTLSNEQLRETEDQLREAIIHANAANQAKSRFLATVSHEIRTPLNGILGMTRLARQANVDERQANYLQTVSESGESLLKLINELLDFSKLESGKMQLETIPVRPRMIANEICRLMAPSAEQKSVALNCCILPQVPEFILGDPSRLRQIVLNLIGNAIKFTAQGHVALTIDYGTHGERENVFQIQVQDTGIGIPADRIESIFESFSQVDSSTTRRYGGTGLGLAICRELTELMGGSITVESELGVGSTFTVVLPIIACDADMDLPPELPWESPPPPTAAVKLAMTPVDPERSGSDIRILIAEDGLINQEVIVGMLELQGYQVVVANNGREAVEQASASSFAICLMDVDMPEMDGLEATRMIRATVPGAGPESLPIIAMTAHSGDQIWAECEAAGMNAFISKPIDPKTLFDTIERFQASRPAVTAT